VGSSKYNLFQLKGRQAEKVIGRVQIFGRQISFHTNHIYRVYPDRMGLPRT